MFESVELKAYNYNNKVTLHISISIKQKNSFFDSKPIICIENPNTDNKKISIKFYNYDDQFFDEILEEMILIYLRKKEKQIMEKKLEFTPFHVGKHDFETCYYFSIKI